MKRISLFQLLFLGMVWLGGCATTSNNYDPIEPVNRGIYQFNRVFDKYLARPIAKGYDKVTPEPVKRSVTNFYFNLGGIRNTVHDLLQGKPKRAKQDISRFVVNTTIGILGLFDVATEVGIEKNKEDFGQTIGVWGIKNPPFLMLPFLGPSNFVDAPGLLIDSFLGPYPYMDDVTARNILLGLDFVRTRASVLSIDKTIDEQVDPYIFVRNAYQQKRRSEIRDGEDEELDEEDELDEEEEEDELDEEGEETEQLKKEGDEGEGKEEKGEDKELDEEDEEIERIEKEEGLSD